MQELCDKLGLLIKIESEENEYTKINIIFPKGNFSKVWKIKIPCLQYRNINERLNRIKVEINHIK